MELEELLMLGACSILAPHKAYNRVNEGLSSEAFRYEPQQIKDAVTAARQVWTEIVHRSVTNLEQGSGT